MNEKTIRMALERNSIPFQEELPEKLNMYYMLLREWNNLMDLTSVTEDEETIDKHFIDSLIVLKHGIITEGTRMIDVGTGAGFPGMVLALAKPALHVTLLDSQQKRLSFLKTVAETASAHNITIVHARAEDGARKQDMREQYDYAVARALAPLNVLCEYLLPYVKVNGYALCWKGPALRNEMKSGSKAAQMLGGTVEIPLKCGINGRAWEHMILPIRKVQKTDARYPRKAGIPKSKPLGI